MSSSISKIYKPGIVLVFLYVFSLQVTAQSFSSAPSLRQLTRSSGYIFAGKVSGIDRVAARTTPVFLYRPSKLGLTSPVAGALGRFAVDKTGQINLRDRIASL